MADYLRKYKSLYASTTNTFGTGTGVTITPASVSGLPTDTEITLTFDRVDSGGTETPNAMERIIGTISGGNFVVRTSPSSGRGADGTTEQSHTSPVVEHILNAKDWNDVVDGFLVQHSQAGAHTNITASTVTSSYVSASSVTASAITINAVTVPTISSTNTFTNKRITPRVSTETSSATPTINTDNVDMHTITALATAITSMTTNLSGTPTNGQKLIIRILDNGTARGITWGASFASRGATLPTTTVLSKYQYNGFIYNSTTSTWDCVSSINES